MEINFMSDKEFLDYRQRFFGWARKKWPSIAENDIEEVFADSLAVYIENERLGKIKKEVAPSTFIIAVGKRKFLKLHGNQKKEMPLEFDPPVEENNRFRIIEVVRENIHKISDKCLKLLIGKYYYGLSAKELMEELDAASENVIRQLQRRCRNKLRDFFDDDDLEELGLI